MKLKNTSGKIIGIGETVFLPNETKEVSGYDNNTALKALIKRKDLTVVKAPAGRK